MRKYTWDEYYEKFFDWAESTQVRNLSALTSLGPADEVGEIIIELQTNIPAANRLLKKAVEAKLEFSGEDLLEFSFEGDIDLVTEAVKNSASRLTAGDMEQLYGNIDDDDIIEICEQQGLVLPEDLREYEESDELDEDWDDDDFYDDDNEAPAKKPGFLAFLFSIFAASAGDDEPRHHRHSGRCDGDCAHCPPHYGYRYGRWYYGHDHSHGCEFGGNKGSGSMD